MKKRIFKKNQIIVTALAILIAVAGYINYADSALKKEDSAGSASAGKKPPPQAAKKTVFWKRSRAWTRILQMKPRQPGKRPRKTQGKRQTVPKAVRLPPEHRVRRC